MSMVADSNVKRARTSSWPAHALDTRLDTVKRYSEDLSVLDLAEIFGVTAGTIVTWTKSGYLPKPYNVEGEGRKHFYARPDVIAAIKHGRGNGNKNDA